MRMTGGTITVTDASRGISRGTLRRRAVVRLAVDRAQLRRDRPLHLARRAFDASANAGDLLAALSGDRSGLKLRLAGAPFKLAFDGHMSQRPSLKVEGTLAVDGKSLREAMRWINRQELCRAAASGRSPSRRRRA